jgi:NAD(P)-dependent dehydrogenase (short-subunit alcohol dehydrogenase family)
MRGAQQALRYSDFVKTLLITGGTGNLGSTVVRRLAQDYRCIVLYHAEAGWQALRKVVDVEGVAANLSDEADVKRAVDQCGEVYGLVHLVGGFAEGGVDAEESVWSNMMSLNLTTAATVIRAVLPHLTDGGRVVAISSYVTLKKRSGLAPYIVSKSALNALIEVLAIELRKRGITANAILPDALAEPAMREHVAETIAWLLSDSAAKVSGLLIPMVA